MKGFSTEKAQRESVVGLSFKSPKTRSKAGSKAGSKKAKKKRKRSKAGSKAGSVTSDGTDNGSCWSGYKRTKGYKKGSRAKGSCEPK